MYDMQDGADHRRSWGRHFRRSIAQPPAQSMINTEFRSDCSGIYEVSLENLQGWRSHKVSWTTCSNAWLSLWWKLFPYLAVTSLILIHTCCLLFSHHVPLRRAWLHLLDSLHVGIGRLLLGAPKAVPSPGWTGPAPAGSPHRASALGPDQTILVALL